MAWDDIVESNLQRSSPETQAKVDLYRNQAIGVAQENRVRGLQLQYQQALAGSLPGALSSNAPGGGLAASAGLFGDNQLTTEARSEASGVASPEDATDDPGSGHSLNREAAIQAMQQRFAPVLPGSYSPGEIQSLQYAALSGNTAATDFIRKQHLLRVDTANAKNTQRATSEYNNLAGVASAPAGRALDALSLVEPQAADRLRGDGANDAEVRKWATEAGAIVHRAARLPVEYRADGTAIDGATKQPIIGFDEHVGLTAEQRAGLSKSATEKVDTLIDGRAVKQPRWQVEGAKSAQDWLAQHLDLADRMRNGSPQPQQYLPPGAGMPNSPVARLFSPQGAPNPGVAPSATQNQPQPFSFGQVPQHPQQSQPPRPSTQQPGQVDPTLKGALSDTNYRVKMPTAPPGGSFLPDEQKERDNIVESRNTLLKDSQEATQAAAQSMTYLKAAKAIMDSKGATVGAYGGIMSQASKWLPFTGNVDATNYQEVAKYLGNAALAAAKGTYGSKMTQSEVGLQLNELSPSVHMTDSAINDLLNENLRNSKYTIDSGKRASLYLAAGNDPRRFREWNEEKFSQNQAVNAPRAPAPAVGTVSKGYKFTGGNPSNKANWVKQ